MDYGTKLVSWIDQHVERTSEDGLRNHLGASVVGDECLRKIWLSFRWTAREEAPGRMQRLWLRGHREEDVFSDLLRSLGATVYQVDPVNGKQFRVSGAGGHFGGSNDAVAVGLPEINEPVLCEFKTHNEKSFLKLKKDGLVASKPEHYYQSQVYMRKMGLNLCLYLAVNKNDDELFATLYPLDAGVADAIIARGETLPFCELAPPRISETPSFWKCKWCKFSDVCHGKSMPLVNCRTCAHATAERDGTWSCARQQTEITTSPKAGCSKHLFHPMFFTRHSVVRSDLESITYRDIYGKELTNGTGGQPSKTFVLPQC